MKIIFRCVLQYLTMFILRPSFFGIFIPVIPFFKSRGENYEDGAVVTASAGIYRFGVVSLVPKQSSTVGVYLFNFFFTY